jgi:hypothetical protein
MSRSPGAKPSRHDRHDDEAASDARVIPHPADRGLRRELDIVVGRDKVALVVIAAVAMAPLPFENRPPTPMHKGDDPCLNGWS